MEIRKADSKGRITLGKGAAGRYFVVTAESSDGFTVRLVPGWAESLRTVTVDD